MGQLQFGHSVAAVDDVGQRCRGFNTGRLQFGHSVAAVDDTGGTYAPRPRRTRFNSATASPPWMTSPEWAEVRKTFQLQFGHSVAAVDDNRNRREGVSLWPLQFGHSVAAVDDKRSLKRRKRA